MNELRNPICFARFISRSLAKGSLVTGHNFDTSPKETPDNIHIVVCKTCGHESLGWSWGSLEEFK